MKHALPLVALMAFTSAAQADCDVAAIGKALDAPLEAMKPYERDVTDVQSTEGGVWQVYREKDGRLNTIVRIDAGESGRNDARLSVVNRQTYGIAVTRTDYLRHAFVEEGPFGIWKKSTEYFYFCGGKAHIPSETASMVDQTEYPKAAAAAKATFLDDKDVAEFVKGLAK